jgi:maleylacetoacetate isomerase
MASLLKLHSYWRSSASYRVRIALNLKGLAYEIVPVNIAPGVSEQLTDAFRRHNPQRLVPILVDGERVFRQSLAIIEYLDEAYPGPALLPSAARDRARARAIAQLVACEMQPMQNLRVLRHLEGEYGLDEGRRSDWVRHWIVEGFSALEDLIAGNPSTGDFCEGNSPTVADICLVPQCYAARRFGVDLARFPTIAAIDARCRALPAFAAAAPEAQPDAPRD